MTQINVIRFGSVLGLLLVGAASMPFVLADDAAINPPIANAPTNETTLETPHDLACIIWDVLDAIEHQHVSHFPRSELMKAVASVLTKMSSGPEFDQVAGNLLRCQNAQEMGDEISGLWQGSQPRVSKVDEVATHTVERLEKVVGDLRLIRAKDYVVEQQIGGNRYVGIGVAISIDDQRHVPRFSMVFPGGPADRGGLHPEDLVTSIDGKPTKSQELVSLIDRLRGPAGTEVQLQILDPKSNDRRDVTLIRGVVRTDSLRDQSREPLSRGKIQSTDDNSIGWIQMPTLTGSTVHELRAADERARAANLRAIVFDFRYSHSSNNLHEAKLVADALLDGGTIWTRVDREGLRIPELADRDCLFRNLPLVVLVDDTTGPLHRVLAAALQDAERATIVGPKYQRAVTEGLIATAEKLPNCPYALSMCRTRLNRARPERDWPLVPDHLVAEPDMQNAARNLSLRGHQLIEQRSIMVVKTEQPASALEPANQTVRRFIAKLPLVIAPRKIDPPAVKLLAGETADEIALRVARDLMKRRGAG